MRLPPLKLRRGDRAVLESWTRAGTIEARMAKRARIVLLAAEGEPIARSRGRSTCITTRSVCGESATSEYGVAGLDDAERSGRPCVYDHDDVLLLVKLVTEEPPDEATRWTMEALAERWRPTGCRSRRPRLANLRGPGPQALAGAVLDDEPRPRVLGEGGRRVRALPQSPENAVVWSVDEKSGMQAKSRINPTKPAVPVSRRGASSSTSATAPQCSSPALDVHEAGGRLGHRFDPLGKLRRVLGRSRRPDARPVSTCTASSTTSRPMRPTRCGVLGRAPPRAHALHPDPCQLAQPGRAASSPSWNAGCCAGASSTPSRTSPSGSSPSSRTTTDGPRRSDGPTTAAR